MVTVACLCPPRADGTPRHPDGDEVTLRERLDFHGARTVDIAMRSARQDDVLRSVADIKAELDELYILCGVVSWTVEDAAGKPVPVSPTAIRGVLLARPDEAIAVADEAARRYDEQVIRPLVVRGSSSSPPTPTEPSTSATDLGPTTPRTPSSPSSTSTTQTDATVTTTSVPVGAFSFSQS